MTLSHTRRAWAGLATLAACIGAVVLLAAVHSSEGDPPSSSASPLSHEPSSFYSSAAGDWTASPTARNLLGTGCQCNVQIVGGFNGSKGDTGKFETGGELLRAQLVNPNITGVVDGGATHVGATLRSAAVETGLGFKVGEVDSTKKVTIAPPDAMTIAGYTIKLPNTAPATNEFLQSTDGTNTKWSNTLTTPTINGGSIAGASLSGATTIATGSTITTPTINGGSIAGASLSGATTITGAKFGGSTTFVGGATVVGASLSGATTIATGSTITTPTINGGSIVGASLSGATTIATGATITGASLSGATTIATGSTITTPTINGGSIAGATLSGVTTFTGGGTLAFPILQAGVSAPKVTLSPGLMTAGAATIWSFPVTAATDTLVGADTTQTLKAKTLDDAKMTGTTAFQPASSITGATLSSPIVLNSMVVKTVAAPTIFTTVASTGITFQNVPPGVIYRTLKTELDYYKTQHFQLMARNPTNMASFTITTDVYAVRVGRSITAHFSGGIMGAIASESLTLKSIPSEWRPMMNIDFFITLAINGVRAMCVMEIDYATGDIVAKRQDGTSIDSSNIMLRPTSFSWVAP